MGFNSAFKGLKFLCKLYYYLSDLFSVFVCVCVCVCVRVCVWVGGIIYDRVWSLLVLFMSMFMQRFQ